MKTKSAVPWEDGALLHKMNLFNCDCIDWAFASADATAEAGVLVHFCLAVNHFNCLRGASAFAGLATNALFCINFCCHFQFSWL